MHDRHDYPFMIKGWEDHAESQGENDDMQESCVTTFLPSNDLGPRYPQGTSPVIMHVLFRWAANPGRCNGDSFSTEGLML